MTNPQATTQTPGTDYVTQREFTTENAHHSTAITTLRQELTASINSTRTEFEGRIKYEREIADLRVRHEQELRQLTERLKNDAIEKAEASIMEKSASHNDLIRKMENQQATYVTKDELNGHDLAARNRVAFLITLGGFAVLLLNLILRAMGK